MSDIKRYKLGSVTLKWVYENEQGNHYRGKSDNDNEYSFYESNLTDLGAKPITEDKNEFEEIEEVIGFDVATEEEKDELINMIVRRQNKIIKQLESKS